MIRALDPAPVDGVKLRRDLTDAARSREGDESALRSAATPILREAWKRGREDVRRKLEAGAGGLETARALSRLADEIVSALYDYTTVHVYRARNPTEGERLSVCAGGGYGRGELAPYSDLDLHFLRAYKPTPWGESVIETMLYALYDLGAQVGHSTRSVEQAIRLSKEDWTVFTNLFDLRRVAGDSELPEALSRRLRDEVMKGRAREFIAAKLGERNSRIAKGATRYMVEPDVKSGKGGLRDLQTLDWLARGVTAGSGESAPVAALFRREEARRFEYAADFLWRVRCCLHFVAGRPQERLSFDLQPEVAALMGFTDSETEVAVERFMRRYFLVARDVGSLTRILCAKMEAEEERSAPLGLRGGLAGVWARMKKKRALPDARFRIEAGRVAFASGVRPEADPAAMIALFDVAARERLDLHPDALAMVDRALDRMDDAARRDRSTIDAFLRTLLSPETVEQALKTMNEAGLLGVVVPEFGGIVGRTQFNMYHHFTVDEHTLRVIGALAALETGALGEDSAFAEGLFEKIGSRRALYLAALLHDVGKGKGDQQIEGAKLAHDASLRLGLDESEARLVSWLVGHHLRMSDTAQRRDLSDPHTVTDFAAEVGSTENLRLLTLLTIADIQGVGPGVWTPWKRKLLQDLYAFAEAAFRGERADEDQVAAMIADRARAARGALLAAAADKPFTERWAQGLENAYWLQFEADDHARHRDFAATVERRRLAVDVDARWNESTGWADLMVLTPDRAGLFAAIAGAIARAGGDVRRARIYTTAQGTAVDFFSVTPPEGVEPRVDSGWLTRLREAALEAARGTRRTPPPAAKISRRAAAFEVAASVTFDDDASHGATIIEVSGRDRPGLLAALGQALADMGISVTSANLEAIGERAMDVFYAVERNGGKIPQRRWPAIRDRLLAAFLDGAPEAPKAGGRELARARASVAR